MLGSIRLLDRILRGEMTRPSQLRDGKLTFPIFGVSLVGIVLAMTYGTCMGLYSILRAFENITFPDDYRQLLASTVKTPALFFLTLVITFPSLYVFNALVGSRLLFGSMLRLLLSSLGVNLAVLASFGPILAFFSMSTNSYGFMVLMNVAMFAVAGGLGLAFLIQTLNRLQNAQTPLDQLEVVNEQASPSSSSTTPLTESAAREEPTPNASDAQNEPASAAAPYASPYSTPYSPAAPSFRARPLPYRPGAIDPIEGHSYGFQVRFVFGIWILVFGVVGAQMGWVLRPFIGSPNQEFTWFRPRDSNFFQAVSTTFFDVMFGAGPKRPTNDPTRSTSPTRER